MKKLLILLLFVISSIVASAQQVFIYNAVITQELKIDSPKYYIEYPLGYSCVWDTSITIGNRYYWRDKSFRPNEFINLGDGQHVRIIARKQRWGRKIISITVYGPEQLYHYINAHY